MQIESHETIYLLRAGHPITGAKFHWHYGGGLIINGRHLYAFNTNQGVIKAESHELYLPYPILTANNHRQRFLGPRFSKGDFTSQLLANTN